MTIEVPKVLSLADTVEIGEHLVVDGEPLEDTRYVILGAGQLLQLVHSVAQESRRIGQDAARQQVGTSRVTIKRIVRDKSGRIDAIVESPGDIDVEIVEP